MRDKVSILYSFNPFCNLMYQTYIHNLLERTNYYFSSQTFNGSSTPLKCQPRSNHLVIANHYVTTPQSPSSKTTPNSQFYNLLFSYLSLCIYISFFPFTAESTPDYIMKPGVLRSRQNEIKC